MIELLQAKLQERERILEMIRTRLTYYPEDIFTPISVNDVVPSRDRVSAQMARFLLKSLIEEIESEE